MEVVNEMNKLRTYTEFSRLLTFEERYRYLKLGGQVGLDTFGFERIFNQRFYKSKEWADVRNAVIVRDCGCDLGIDGLEIFDRPIVHHMNPITIKDLHSHNDILLNPEYLVLVSHRTHNAIHYGDDQLLKHGQVLIEREPNDTCPWKGGKL